MNAIECTESDLSCTYKLYVRKMTRSWFNIVSRVIRTENIGSAVRKD